MGTANINIANMYALVMFGKLESLELKIKRQILRIESFKCWICGG